MVQRSGTASASSQRRDKKTASKQIRTRSRRQQRHVGDEDLQDESDDELDSKNGGDNSADSDSQAELRHHQQLLLDIFRDSFRDVLEHDSFAIVLQGIKQALYEREFERVFAEPRNLEVYAARWSPTRALCYSRIFAGISDEIEQMIQSDSGDDGAILRSSSSGEGGLLSSQDGQDGQDEQDGQHNLEDAVQNLNISTSDNNDEHISPQSQPSRPPPLLRVLAVGGGAAELVAFASYISKTPPALHQAGHITLLDIGPWGGVVQTLHKHVVTAPVLSKYANAAAKAANAALVSPPERFSSKFVHRDVLDFGGSTEELRAVLTQQDDRSGAGSSSSENNGTCGSRSIGHNGVAPQPVLITLLFTLNELYTTSGIGRTTKFLRNLSATVSRGSLLLVVDSPGSYSEASVGKEGAKKKYPMQWLLDHTLLHDNENSSRRRRKEGSDLKEGEGEHKEKEEEEEGSAMVAWEKLDAHSHESMWFRMPEGLRYPIALENMRYQMHLYRAV